MKMKYLLTCIAPLLLVSCHSVDAVRNNRSASPTPRVQLSQIDLSQIGHLAPKGRVQDKDYNQLPVIEQLLSHGKDSIPFLISKLEDETKIEGHTIDYWNQVYVGDVALIILSNFFLDSKWRRSTIEGMEWDEFLERGNDKNITGEQLLRNYVERHGRKRIKERWQDLWQKYQPRIFWDEQERAFKLTTL
jgi:hypothetical protein